MNEFKNSVISSKKSFTFPSAQDPDPLDPQDFGFLDPDPQKYTDPRIRIQGAKYQPKKYTALISTCNKEPRVLYIYQCSVLGEEDW